MFCVRSKKKKTGFCCTIDHLARWDEFSLSLSLPTDKKMNRAGHAFARPMEKDNDQETVIDGRTKEGYLIADGGRGNRRWI